MVAAPSQRGANSPGGSDVRTQRHPVVHEQQPRGEDTRDQDPRDGQRHEVPGPTHAH